MNDNEKQKLRELAKHRLSLYARELGTLYDKLAANQPAWRCGYDEMDDYYWVTPDTVDGSQIPPPFGTLKWGGGEIPWAAI